MLLEPHVIPTSKFITNSTRVQKIWIKMSYILWFLFIFQGTYTVLNFFWPCAKSALLDYTKWHSSHNRAPSCQVIHVMTLLGKWNSISNGTLSEAKKILMDKSSYRRWPLLNVRYNTMEDAKSSIWSRPSGVDSPRGKMQEFFNFFQILLFQICNHRFQIS